MLKHRQMTIQVGHFPVLAIKSQLGREGSRTSREDRQLQLRHVPVLRRHRSLRKRNPGSIQFPPRPRNHGDETRISVIGQSRKFLLTDENWKDGTNRNEPGGTRLAGVVEAWAGRSRSAAATVDIERTRDLAWMPVWRAFMEETALPVTEVGPVDFWALRRLASI